MSLLWHTRKSGRPTRGLSGKHDIPEGLLIPCTVFGRVWIDQFQNNPIKGIRRGEEKRGEAEERERREGDSIRRF